MRRSGWIAVVGVLAAGCLLPDLDTKRVDRIAATGGQQGTGATGGSNAGGAQTSSGGGATGGDGSAQTGGSAPGGTGGATGSPATGGATDSPTAGAAGMPASTGGSAGKPAGTGGSTDATAGAGGAAGSGTAGMAGGGAAAAGPCGPQGPSCKGLASCDEQTGVSCCESLLVSGGAFERNPGGSPAYEAEVDDFCLDRFEVTVGRFRKFVAAYDAWRSAGHPEQSEGQHPQIGAGSGWKAEYDAMLPDRAVQLTGSSRLDPGDAYQTWSDDVGTAAAERLPVNSVSWYEAFAFCIWDGGGLATEAEWQYAAQGGDLNRNYPWGDNAPDPSLAVYACGGDGDPESCSYADILPVGSRRLGDGYWGQSDLAGGLWEWVLDTFDEYPEACANCANLSDGAYRVTRGGSWHSDADSLLGRERYDYLPANRTFYLGFRCARAAE
ncbi:MAG: formylglycine-generating enzyme family protein [Polyangiaceae bacterium]|nr:formylglycine-generating enzyme family protein [Polyangiaceae bacterium]